MSKTGRRKDAKAAVERAERGAKPTPSGPAFSPLPPPKKNRLALAIAVGLVVLWIAALLVLAIVT